MTTSKLDIGLRIRHDIVSGALRFGDRVTMDALASRYGVSRMVRRAAARCTHPGARRSACPAASKTRLKDPP